MSGWRGRLAAGRSRATAGVVVQGAAWGLLISAGGVAVWSVVARAGNWPVGWWYAAGGLGLGLVAGGVVGWSRRPSVLAVANRLDASVSAGHDAIASAVQFSARERLTAAESAALATADAAAERVDLGRAWPLDVRGPLSRLGVAGVVVAGAMMMPAGWLGSLARGVGIGGSGPSRVAIAEAVADTAVAEKLVQAATPTASPASPAGETGKMGGLEDLQRELSRGLLSPREARERAASAVERAAEGLERRAEGDLRAHQQLKEALARGAQGSVEKKSDGIGADGRVGTGEELARALREGDLERAAKAAERLAGGEDGLAPAERAKLAEELKQAAERLKGADRDARTEGEPAKETGDSVKGEKAPPTRPEGGKEASKGASDSQPEKKDETQRLADEMQRAAEELERPPASDTPSGGSPKQTEPQPPQTGEQQRDPKGQDGSAGTPQQQQSPQKQEQTQRSDSKGEQTGKPDGAKEQEQAKPAEPKGQQGSGQEEIQGEKQPQQQGEKAAGEKRGGEKLREQPNGGESAENQSGGEKLPQERKEGGSQQEKNGQGREDTKGEKPREGSPQSQPGGAQPQGEKQGGDAPKQRDVGGEKSGGEKPQDQPDREGAKGYQERQGETPSEKQRQNDKQQQGEKQSGAKQTGESTGDQLDGRKQDEKGEQGRKHPQGGESGSPSMKNLSEQLKKLADRPRQAKESKENAQQLREQARKLWENATPEQRKEMEKVAREMAKRNQKGESPGGENESLPRALEGQGLAQRDEAGGGKGAGNGEAGSKPPGRTAAHQGQVQDVDARREANRGEAPGRVIAEWLSNRDNKQTGSGSGGAPADVAKAVEQAQRAAEQAVSERAVPARLSPLVRKFFERLPQAVGEKAPAAAPAEPGNGTRP